MAEKFSELNITITDTGLGFEVGEYVWLSTNGGRSRWYQVTDQATITRAGITKSAQLEIKRLWRQYVYPAFGTVREWIVNR